MWLFCLGRGVPYTTNQFWFDGSETRQQPRPVTTLTLIPRVPKHEFHGYYPEHTGPRIFNGLSCIKTVTPPNSSSLSFVKHCTFHNYFQDDDSFDDVATYDSYISFPFWPLISHYCWYCIPLHFFYTFNPIFPSVYDTNLLISCLLPSYLSVRYSPVIALSNDFSIFLLSVSF